MGFFSRRRMLFAARPRPPHAGPDVRRRRNRRTIRPGQGPLRARSGTADVGLIPATDGGTVQIRRSVDDAVSCGPISARCGTKRPAWLVEKRAGPAGTTMWGAGRSSAYGSTYFMYYAVSTLGQQNSVIALARNHAHRRSLVQVGVDAARVIRSAPSSGTSTPSIPTSSSDAAGTAVLVFGPTGAASRWCSSNGRRACAIRRQDPGSTRRPGKDHPNAIEAPTSVHARRLWST
jgi:hypothetical protein